MVPQGYIPNPQAPGWFYNPANPSAPQVQDTAPAQQAAPGQPTYGSVDAAAVQAQYDELKKRSSGQFNSDDIWIDFPEESIGVGEEKVLHVRFLPPWAKGELFAHVERLQYRIPKWMWPNSKAKKIEIVTSHNTQGGPGNCPIQAAIDHCLTVNTAEVESIKALRARKQFYWQAVDTSDTQKHWAQQKDTSGNVILDATGQPVWFLKPGLISMGPQLHQNVLKWHVQRQQDFTDIQLGFPLRLIKRRTGSGEMDIEYDAIDLTPAPLDAGLMPILEHLVDLRDRFHNFRERAEMDACAQQILTKYGHATPAQSQVPGVAPIPAVGQLLPGYQAHPTTPGYQWNPQTNDVQPMQAAPVPIAPPVAPVYAPPAAPAAAPPQQLPAPAQQAPPAPPVLPGQPVPAALPGPPQGAQPPLAAPPPAPPPAPPVGAAPPPPAQAPGLVAGAPPAPPAPPAAAAAPPGMPSGVVPSAPPPGPAPATGVMTPGQLEGQLAGPPPPPPPSPYGGG